MADTPKGRATRRRILDAAWELADARGVELILGGVTLREIAAAVDMAPSAVTYHFPTMSDLALGMVAHLVHGISPLPVAAVDAMLDQVDDDGPVAAVRHAAELNWQLLTSPDEVAFERRLVRCYAAANDDETVTALLAELVANWVADLTLAYERALGRQGLTLIEPFETADLARAMSGMADGLLHHWMCDPTAVRADLLADVAVGLMSSIVAPTHQQVTLDEVSATLSAARPGALGPEELVERAAPASALFVDGIDAVTLTEAARHLEMDTVEVATTFGSVARLAATSFGRHLPAVEDAVSRRGDAGAAVALTDGVYELARCALSDRHCALALAHERHRAYAAATPGASSAAPMAILELVPVGPVLAVPLGELLDRPPTESIDLADLVVDSVLTHAATRPRTPPAGVTETALRLVPADF